MSMNSSRRFALMSIAAWPIVAALNVALAAESTVRLRVLETTDIHVHVLNYDYYRDAQDHTMGLSKTATLIRQARQEAPNSLLIDNGDLIQGNPMGDYIARKKGLKDGDRHPVYKAMNLLNYDAGNIGNHEFNYGLEYLNTALKGANFPYVNANVYHADGQRNYFTPYLILERKLKDESGKEWPIKVGVIGFTPPQIMQWDKGHLSGKVTTKDIVETAEKFVPEMKVKGADLVIAVPHSGIGSIDQKSGAMEENATYGLSKVKGIDAILFGHSHLVFPSETYKNLAGVDIAKGTINGVPSVMPGFWGSHLGFVDFDLRVDDKGKWRVADALGVIRSIYKVDGRNRIPLVDNDPAIVEAVKHDHEETLAYVRAGIGKTSAAIHSYFALVQDDPSIQIVTDAQTWYARRMLQGTEYDKLPILSAGAPFKAGGRGGPDYYTDIKAGEIAIKNAADLYLYPNELQAVVVTGAGVKEWLEMSAGIFKRIDPGKSEPQPLIEGTFPSFNFDVIDGVTYTIDVTKPPRYDTAGNLVEPTSHRIGDLKYDGKPIDMNQRFVVVTNNYRAGGGGKFPGLDGKNVILEAPDENRTALINYINERGTVNPSADGNWRFAKIGNPVVVTFESSPKAADLLKDFPQISAAGAGENGFSRYHLKLD
jgi:2',3'-cyclic-nucleotide 2'-phosphodiesterase/3'-nucleotidase